MTGRRAAGSRRQRGAVRRRNNAAGFGGGRDRGERTSFPPHGRRHPTGAAIFFAWILLAEGEVGENGGGEIERGAGAEVRGEILISAHFHPLTGWLYCGAAGLVEVESLAEVFPWRPVVVS
jgi:hypothetical protein